MNRVHFRKWFRDKFNMEVRTDKRGRIYLEKFPFFRDYVPLGKRFQPSALQPIQMVDGELLSRTWLKYGDTIHFADASGLSLGMVRKTKLRFRAVENVHEAFSRLPGESQRAVRYVVVLCGPTKETAVITLYKLPKDQHPAAFMDGAYQHFIDDKAEKVRAEQEDYRQKVLSEIQD